MYKFDISYPADDKNLVTLEKNIMRRFPQIDAGQKFYHAKGVIDDKAYYSTLYSANSPSDIARVASALKHADPRIFVAYVSDQGTDIYLHPLELETKTSSEQQKYLELQTNLSQNARIIHDYLVNLYKNVPT